MSEGGWRVGTHYALHVYEPAGELADRPVATFHRPEDAAAAVAAYNARGHPMLDLPADTVAVCAPVDLKVFRGLYDALTAAYGPQLVLLDAPGPYIVARFRP